jgi:hypothetical protein
MNELDPSHHIFRHVGATKMHGDFVDPEAFALRTDEDTGEVIEPGLSVNWVEYFTQSSMQAAVAPLRYILEKKGRTVGGKSRFALLNVGATKAAAAKYVAVTVATDDDPQDPSHAQVKGYRDYNVAVSEELAKIVIATYPAKA